MSTHFHSNLVALLPINLASGTEDYPHLTQIVEGHRQLHSAKLLIEHLPGGFKDSLAQKLFDNVFEVYNVIVTESC